MLVVFLIIFSFYVPYAAYRKGVICVRYLFLLSVLVAIHHIISLNTSTVSDMMDFNNYAKQGLPISTFSINNAFNISIVYGWFYRLQNDVLVGNSLGIVGYTIAMIFLCKIMSLMEMTSIKKTWTMVLASIAPAALYYDSSILREPWMLCFFIMFIYFLFNHYVYCKKKYMFYALCALLLLLCLHFKSAAFYCLFIFIGYLMLYSKQFYRVSFAMKLFSSIIVLFVLVLSIEYLTVFFGASKSSIYEFLTIKIKFFIDHQYKVSSGTNYTLLSDTQDNLIIVMIKQYFRYWFAPYPWQLFSHGIVSITLGIVALIRFVMLAYIIRFLCKNYQIKGKDRGLISILLLALFFTTLIFSLGTGNYGTSNRHWDISWWILCLLFVYTREKTIRMKI